MPSTENNATNIPDAMLPVYSLFRKGMLERYASAIEKITPFLRDEARCASDAALKEAFVLAIESTFDKQEEMAEKFEALLDKEFTTYLDKIRNIEKYSKSVSAVNIDVSHLSLVDDDCLQEKIAIQTMVANTLHSCEYLLVPVNSGVNQAYGIPKINQIANPLSPTRIGEWLQDSLAVANFQGKVRQAIYILFQEELFDSLAPLYKQVIDVFQSQSITLAMQQAKTSSLNMDTLTAMSVDVAFASSTPVKKTASGKKAARLSESDTDEHLLATSINRRLDEQVPTLDEYDEAPLLGDDEPMLDEDARVGDAALDDDMAIFGGATEFTFSKPKPKVTLLDIKKILHERRLPTEIQFGEHLVSTIDDSFSLSDISPNDDRTLITVSAKQLDKLLGEIQLEMIRGETDWVERLHQYLQSRTDQHELCVIGEYHENVMRLINHGINLVSSTFHPSVKRYLDSLRVALVRLAITDEQFLNDGMHPAKSFFDAMSCLGYGINPSEKRIIKRLFRAVRSFYDVSSGEKVSFGQCLHDLLGFLREEEQNTLNNERQALEALMLQEQRYLAFKTADAFIETRLKSLTNILLFHKLLHVAMRHVLAENYLSGDQDWQTSTKLFSSLVWVTQAKSNETNQHKILRAMPKIMEKLHEFFRRHHTPLDMQSLIQNQFNEIQKMVLDGQDGDTLTDGQLTHTMMVKFLLDKVKSEVAKRYREEKRIGIENDQLPPFEGVKSVSDLLPGQWLAYLVEGEVVVCKHAFHFTPLDKSVFFDWEGEKQFERESTKVRNDIIQGYAKILGAPMPLESALRFVVSAQ